MNREKASNIAVACIKEAMRAAFIMGPPPNGVFDYLARGTVLLRLREECRRKDKCEAFYDGAVKSAHRQGACTVQRTELTEMLTSALWAKQLKPSQLQRVLAVSTEHRFPAGKYVCRRGDRVDAWTGVIWGLVKLGSASPEGKLVTYTGVTAGGWFGEGSLLKDEPRRYDAVALRDTRIAYIPRTTFHSLLDESIPFNRFIMDQLNARLGQMIAMLEHERLASPDARLAHCLASLFNPQLYPGTSADLRISQEEIGHLSGLSRQRVNRGLHALEKRGILRVQFGGITVTNLAGLRDFIG